MAKPQISRGGALELNPSLRASDGANPLRRIGQPGLVGLQSPIYTNPPFPSALLSAYIPLAAAAAAAAARQLLLSKMNVEKLQKMAGAVRTGGKGSVRRKKKAVHKTTTTDDKRLQSTLKRVGVNAIPGIEEVNIFKDDVVIQFQNPKVQASIAANTWVVSGTPQTKKLQDLLPTIINQLGPDNLDNLRRLAEQFQRQVPGAEAGASAGNGQDDDDDVPELVPGETFEEAAEEKREEPEEKKEAEPEEKKES
ncbi:hypothetical protein GUJ93_ZPchr0013g37063 [Zizania palustris]|uniref:Nascent polypeptide-associated complex subunit beta n=1 Tax=Zizania palustris TaxID=103762 RepID=A0A8J5WY49_ZIZPA|nr:hypothetical protein GUJ93_ZPchr0013g37063 [Zizania palustris]